MIYLLAFYAGWPKAWSAFALIKEVYEDEETPEEHGGVFGCADGEGWYQEGGCY